jgi:hypothetical protein
VLDESQSPHAVARIFIGEGAGLLIETPATSRGLTLSPQSFTPGESGRVVCVASLLPNDNKVCDTVSATPYQSIKPVSVSSKFITSCIRLFD